MKRCISLATGQRRLLSSLLRGRSRARMNMGALLLTRISSVFTQEWENEALRQNSKQGRKSKMQDQVGEVDVQGTLVHWANSQPAEGDEWLEEWRGGTPN